MSDLQFNLAHSQGYNLHQMQYVVGLEEAKPVLLMGLGILVLILVPLILICNSRRREQSFKRHRANKKKHHKKHEQVMRTAVSKIAAVQTRQTLQRAVQRGALSLGSNKDHARSIGLEATSSGGILSRDIQFRDSLAILAPAESMRQRLTDLICDCEKLAHKAHERAEHNYWADAVVTIGAYIAAAAAGADTIWTMFNASMTAIVVKLFLDFLVGFLVYINDRYDYSAGFYLDTRLANECEALATRIRLVLDDPAVSDAELHLFEVQAISEFENLKMDFETGP